MKWYGRRSAILEKVCNGFAVPYWRSSGGGEICNGGGGGLQYNTTYITEIWLIVTLTTNIHLTSPPCSREKKLDTCIYIFIGYIFCVTKNMAAPSGRVVVGLLRNLTGFCASQNGIVSVKIEYSNEWNQGCGLKTQIKQNKP